jgi:hypothetical protein
VPAALGVLDGDLDPDGGPAITIASVVGCADVTAPFDCTLAGQGTLSLHADGSFTFVPEPGDTDPTATFQYMLTGNAVNMGTVTLTRFQRVWYVDPTAGAGSGTSSSPLNTIDSLDGAGGVGDSDVTGDYIFVHEGTLALAAPMVMEANQHLIGEGVGLSIPVNLNGAGSPTVLVAPGTHPQLTNATGDAVTATEAVPVEIVGLSLQGAPNAIDLTTDAALTGSGTLTIGNNILRGATLEGIDVSLIAGTTGTLNLAITSNTWHLAGTHTGNALDVNHTAGAGTLNLSFNGNTNILSAANAVVINGGGVANTTLTGFSSNNVHGNTGAAGVIVTNATFDSNVGAGGFQQVDGDNMAIGASGNPVGGAGVALTTVQGNLFFDDLVIYAAVGTALQVTGAGGGMTFAVTPASPDGSGTSVIDADNGVAVDISSTALDLRLSDLESNTSVSGVSLNTVGGQFRAPAGSQITKASGGGTAFSVASSVNGTTVTYGGTLNVTSGSGVSLTNNVGSTISFSGGMTLSTGANAGFSASGGGTVTVTDPPGLANNTITTTSGTALNVSNTTIGAAGLTFESISAGTSGSPVNGILLNTTGASGGLTVSGTGTNNSGGVIQNTTADGVSLTSTRNITLNEMRVFSSNGNNIDANTVTNLTLNSMELDSSNGEGILGNSVTNLVISGGTFNRGGADSEPTCNTHGVLFNNLLGTSSVTGATFSRANTIQFRVNNSAATNAVPGAPDTLTFSGTTWNEHNGPCGGDHLSVNADTGGNFKLITNSTSGENNFGAFTGTCIPTNCNGGGTAVQISINNSGKLQASITGVESNNTTAGVAVGTGGGATGTIQFDVFDNRTANGTGFANTGSVALIMTCSAGTGGVCEGAFRNNSITHGAGAGTNAIQTIVQGDGTGRVRVEGNTVTGNFQRGFHANSGSGTGSSNLQLSVTSNSLTGTDATGLQGMNIETSLSGDATIVNTMCLNLQNNTVSMAGGLTAYRVVNRANDVFQLQNFVGNGNLLADIQTWVTTTKTNTGTPVAATIGQTYLTSPACALPTLPTP